MVKSFYRYINRQAFNAEHVYNDGELIDSIMSYRNVKMDETRFDARNNFMRVMFTRGNVPFDSGVMTITVKYKVSILTIKISQTIKTGHVEHVFKRKGYINVREWLLKSYEMIDFTDPDYEPNQYLFNLNVVLSDEEIEQLKLTLPVEELCRDNCGNYNYVLSRGIPYYEHDSNFDPKDYYHYTE